MSTIQKPNLNEEPISPLVSWLILGTAALGFAFDIYELLMWPLVGPPAIVELLHLKPGDPANLPIVQKWMGITLWLPAICGGVFGLVGGWLTDRFGRRAVLTYSILLYAGATFAGGFSTSLEMLIACRCLAFIGVCVEFVAAVAWLAELYTKPEDRERALGFTQAFSSIGGLLVTLAYWLLLHLKATYPDVLPQGTWRYLLMSGLIPAIPLILVRPFLPESPVWERKSAEGTLKRPDIFELFQPELIRTTILTTLMMACSYGIAFGAIQQVTQIVKTHPEVIQMLKGQGPAAPGTPAAPMAPAPAPMTPAGTPMPGEGEAPKKPMEPASPPMTPPTTAPAAEESPAPPEKKPEGETKPEAKPETKLEKKPAGVPVGPAGPKKKTAEDYVKDVQLWQEVGGLVGRFALAILLLWLVSNPPVFRLFIIPGMIVVPATFYYCMGVSLQEFEWAMFACGFFTVAQLSFWGNYLPRVFPVHLRGTGESFAANVGGRMIGTMAALVTALISSNVEGGKYHHYVAAGVALFCSIIALGASFFLPVPEEEKGHE